MSLSPGVDPDAKTLPPARPLVACGSLYSYLYDEQSITRYDVKRVEDRKPAETSIDLPGGGESKGVLTCMDCSADGRSFAYVYVYADPVTSSARVLRTTIVWILDGRGISVGALDEGLLDGGTKVSLTEDGNSLIVFKPRQGHQGGWCQVLAAPKQLHDVVYDQESGLITEKPAIAEHDTSYAHALDHPALGNRPARAPSCEALRVDTVGIYDMKPEGPSWILRKIGNGRVLGLATRILTAIIFFTRILATLRSACTTLRIGSSGYGYDSPRPKNTPALPCRPEETSSEFGEEVTEVACHLVPEGANPALDCHIGPENCLHAWARRPAKFPLKDAKLVIKFERLGEVEREPGSRNGRVTFYQYVPRWIQPLEMKASTTTTQARLPCLKRPRSGTAARGSPKKEQQKARPTIKFMRRKSLLSTASPMGLPAGRGWAI